MNKDILKKALHQAKEISSRRSSSKDRTYKLSNPNRRERLYRAADHARRKEENDYERYVHGKSHSLSGRDIKRIREDQRDYYETHKHPDQR